MNVRLEYSKSVDKYLQKLDTKQAQKIFLKIEFYCSQEDPLSYAKKLSKPFEDLYRFRIGEYRAIFEFTNGNTYSLITILKVGHRKEVYE